MCATDQFWHFYFSSASGWSKPEFRIRKRSTDGDERRDSPASQSSEASNVLGQIAIGLAGGSEAMRALRGSPYKDTQKDKLQPPLPGMNCRIERILSYVSCYSALINNEKEAENVFMRLVTMLKLRCHRTGGNRLESCRGSVRSEASVIRSEIRRPARYRVTC